MLVDMAECGADREPPDKQAVRNHQNEHRKTQAVQILEYQRNRSHDEQNHQLVEKGAGRIGLPPPVICFDRIDSGNTQRALRVRLDHPPAPPYPSSPSDRGCLSSGAGHMWIIAAALRQDWCE